MDTVECLNAQGLWPQADLERVLCCPACSASERRDELECLRDDTFGVAPGCWNLKRCLECGAAYLDPRPTPSAIHRAYANYFTHESAGSPTGWAARIRRALGNSYRNRVWGTDLRPSLWGGGLLISLFEEAALRIRAQARGLDAFDAPGRKVLDVGCGNGDFLVLARELGWEPSGIEPDQKASALCLSRGVRVIGSTVGDLGEQYSAHFDVVTLSHVIEHVHDPGAMLRECRRLLKPGGSVWIQTPNIDSVGYEMYGRNWRGLEPPRHLTLFSSKAMRLCLERVGFERIRMLEPQNDAQYTFINSEVMRAGYIASRASREIAARYRSEVAGKVRVARAKTAQCPERAEFLGFMASRPIASQSRNT